MERRLPAGPLIGALGALLLVVSLFLDWYEGITAFTVFELIDLVLVGLALLTAGALFGGAGVLRPASAPAVALAASAITVLVVLSQVVNDPPAVSGPGPGHDTGIWIAVAGSLLMLVGAVLAWGRISLAVDVRPKGSDGGDEPPGRRPGRSVPPEAARGAERRRPDAPPERGRERDTPPEATGRPGPPASPSMPDRPASSQSASEQSSSDPVTEPLPGPRWARPGGPPEDPTEKS